MSMSLRKYAVCIAPNILLTAFECSTNRHLGGFCAMLLMWIARMASLLCFV
uniref:Uncharacterized protein n=1 Tax=Arundo donax TaxID=35708 RepID=A0A0A8XN79_ARUDO